MSRSQTDIAVRASLWLVFVMVALLRFHENGEWQWVLGIAAMLLALMLYKPLRVMRSTRRIDPEVTRVLQDKIRFYRNLEPKEKLRFQRRVQELLAILEFESSHNGEPPELPIRVLAVAGAAVLVHRVRRYRFGTSRAVVIYPDAYVLPDHEDQGEFHAAGTVFGQGSILFSAAALESGWTKSDGRNVSIHEWAHVLDMDDGVADGVPGFVQDLETWERQMGDAMEAARAQRRGAKKSVLRSYAGTNRAETFAVASEVFFERPEYMLRRAPELHALLRNFYVEVELPGDEEMRGDLSKGSGEEESTTT